VGEAEVGFFERGEGRGVRRGVVREGWECGSYYLVCESVPRSGVHHAETMMTRQGAGGEASPASSVTAVGRRDTQRVGKESNSRIFAESNVKLYQSYVS
jgi:hypothetical protein